MCQINNSRNLKAISGRREYMVMEKSTEGFQSVKLGWCAEKILFELYRNQLLITLNNHENICDINKIISELPKGVIENAWMELRGDDNGISNYVNSKQCITANGKKYIERRYNIDENNSNDDKNEMIAFFRQYSPKYKIVSNDIIIGENLVEYADKLKLITLQAEKWVQDNVQVSLPYNISARMIYSNDFIDDRGKVTSKTRGGGADPNGEFIPSSETYDGVATIIINVSKLSQGKRMDGNLEIILGSVVVHEIIHCYDIEKTLKVIGENIPPYKWDSLINVFHTYGEMRSKFYQEIYYIKHIQGVKFSDYVEDILKINKRINDYNNVNQMGQYMAWEKEKIYMGLSDNICGNIDRLMKEKKKDVKIEQLYNKIEHVLKYDDIKELLN